ncbi:serine/threonine protein kinase [Kitasatospora sp. NBC_01287]|uniref:serine/threonine-protein kinase n=1 Tax=Kitasatospora sp. NBC_01287 TaxID=2903573 RepID=UPI0022504C6F|nr:serine/threonine-protein kinase [Kitasatospora sp. NBC_01287]MCX4744801.1 serine/threonine protein kinase [Kitasatospora sp. NBC_01287]
MNGPTEERPEERAAQADGPWTLPGYTEERELGTGGSGRVVLARHDATGTRVAVKYLSKALGGTTAFRREAELLGALRVPQVAQLYEYVEGPRGAAIVMELVDGPSLRALLRQEGATSPEAALAVLKGSLLGLAAAHEAGVVHRDYKPENVLVALDGSSKLVDFGIAVPSGAEPGIAGTPVYMAPEQWTGEPATPSADVYAATATFFECLTGAKPYNGTTLAELAAQHTEAPIPDELAPEPVRPLIRAGLAKTPGERPASAAALVEQLERAARAGYGEDWEERGRDALAALVALLPLLLLPAGGGAATGTTALATTELATTELGGGPGELAAATEPGPGADLWPAAGGSGVPRARLSRRGKLLAGAVGIALLGGAMVQMAAADGSGASGTTAMTGPAPELTTSLAPVAEVSPGGSVAPSASGSASPSASASVSPSPSASPSSSASASASASPAASGTGSPSAAAGASGAPSPKPGRTAPTAGGPGATPTAPTTPAGSPSTAPASAPASAPATTPAAVPTSASAAPPSASPTPPPATLRITGVTISGYGCYRTYGTSGTVTVTSDGAAAGTLTISWVDGGSTRKVVATQVLSIAKGQTTARFAVNHTFADSATMWGLQAGGSYQEVAAYLCNPPR